jgi:hypothetical protein
MVCGIIDYTDGKKYFLTSLAESKLGLAKKLSEQGHSIESTTKEITIDSPFIRVFNRIREESLNL